MNRKRKRKEKAAGFCSNGAHGGLKFRLTRSAGAKWSVLMLMVLCLLLLAVPVSLAETTTGTDYATGTDTSITTPEVEGSAGSDPAAAVSGDSDEIGSIELLLKYKDSSTNADIILDSGALSIYDVTSLRNWSEWTTEQLEEENQTLANSFLANELKGAEALATQKISKGIVKFENLPKGMYLICQTELSDGETKVLPFLMSLPDKDGNMNISAAPKPGIEKEKTPDKPKTPDDPKLPQTGLLLWPVLMLIAGGLLLVLIGTWLRRKDRSGNHVNRS